MIKRNECEEIVKTIKEAKEYFKIALEKVNSLSQATKSGGNGLTPSRCICGMNAPEF